MRRRVMLLVRAKSMKERCTGASTNAPVTGTCSFPVIFSRQYPLLTVSRNHQVMRYRSTSEEPEHLVDHVVHGTPRGVDHHCVVGGAQGGRHPGGVQGVA